MVDLRLEHRSCLKAAAGIVEMDDRLAARSVRAQRGDVEERFRGYFTSEPPGAYLRLGFAAVAEPAELAEATRRLRALLTSKSRRRCR
jgi:hypothetical protein